MIPDPGCPDSIGAATDDGAGAGAGGSCRVDTGNTVVIVVNANVVNTVDAVDAVDAVDGGGDVAW